jgi:carboxymethylenebutenolidase
MAEQIFIEIDGTQVEMLLAVPEHEGPHPALVVAQHLPADRGLEADAFTQNVADRYAEAGYVCAIPYLLHRQPLERERVEKRGYLRDDEVMVDLTAAKNFLGSQDYVDNARLGVLGHCIGGRIAILAAARDPAYKAAVDFWGGGVELGWGDGVPSPLGLVPQIRCPVAGFFGNDDTNPSPDAVDALEAALKENGKAYEFHRYDGAGHAFQNFTNDDRYRPQASEDAWTKAIDFLGRSLADLDVASGP